VKHRDPSDDTELGESEKQLRRSGITGTTTSEVTIPSATLTSPTSPANHTSPSAVPFEERNDWSGRNAIVEIFRYYKGLDFYESSLRLFMKNLSKHKVDEWHALCQLQKITKRGELALFIFEGDKITCSRRQEITSEVQARGVRWTPKFRDMIKVGVLIWIGMLLIKLTYCRRLLNGARNGRLDLSMQLDPLWGLRLNRNGLKLHHRTISNGLAKANRKGWGSCNFSCF
jgi:hypothetical protein